MTPKLIKLVVSAGILTFGFLISPPLHAQVSGASVSGTISDPQGGAIPIAAISVKNAATDVLIEVTTNAVGFYTVPNLTPGDYDVSGRTIQRRRTSNHGLVSPGIRSATARQQSEAASAYSMLCRFRTS